VEGAAGLRGDVVQSFSNQIGGTSLLLTRHDDLNLVPETHSDLLTPKVVEIFRDPHSYFAEIARKAPIAAMQKWLEAMLSGVCFLNLHTTFEPHWREAAFSWSVSSLANHADAGNPDQVVVVVVGEHLPRGAEVTLPHPANLAEFSLSMQTYYSLVGAVRWMGFDHAGGLYAVESHAPMFQGEVTDETRLEWEYLQSEALDPRQTYRFGDCDDGTPFVYTRDGKAGLWGYPERDQGFTMCMEELVDWVFTELIAGRVPPGRD
jgi:hypothetical protein